MLLTLLDLHNSSDDTQLHSVIVNNNNNNNYNNINYYCNKLPLSQDNDIITFNNNVTTIQVFSVKNDIKLSLFVSESQPASIDQIWKTNDINCDG